jgi:hypothetical protein
MSELLPEGRRFRSQLGVWFTAEQTIQAIAAARLAALEEAAKLCEARALGNLQLGAVAHPVVHEMLEARDAEAQCCAAAIRALAACSSVHS